MLAPTLLPPIIAPSSNEHCGDWTRENSDQREAEYPGTNELVVRHWLPFPDLLEPSIHRPRGRGNGEHAAVGESNGQFQRKFDPNWLVTSRSTSDQLVSGLYDINHRTAQYRPLSVNFVGPVV